MADKLAAEIMDAFNEQGGAFKRKEDMHRMAAVSYTHLRSNSRALLKTLLIRLSRMKQPDFVKLSLSNLRIKLDVYKRQFQG